MAKVRKSRALNFITNLFIYEQRTVFSLPRQMFVNLVFISLLVCGWVVPAGGYVCMNYACSVRIRIDFPGLRRIDSPATVTL